MVVVVDVGVVVTTADPGGAGVTTAAGGGGGGGADLVVLEYEMQPEAHVMAASAIPNNDNFIASSPPVIPILRQPALAEKVPDRLGESIATRAVFLPVESN